MLLQPLTTAESCSDWSFFRTQEHKELSIKSWQPRQLKLNYVKSKNQFSNFLIYKEVCWNFHSPMLSCSSVCLKRHHSVKDSQRMLRSLCTNVPYRKITFVSMLSCSPWSRHSSYEQTHSQLAAQSVYQSSAPKVACLTHWTCWAQIMVNFSELACWRQRVKETSRASLISSHAEPSSLSVWLSDCCQSHDTFWKSLWLCL